ncbi:hypothetical protein [Halomarina rubra]|uniref:Rhomboid family intramembrane serine protease n=1 Tax=Halomarina rubra TaxID=2071873 RepID=A0ABD6B025_9EURY|nr:hypothetical protein [Halomarina rubra]
MEWFEIALVYILLPMILAGLWILPGTSAWELNLTTSSVFASPTTIWKTFASGYLHTSLWHLVNNVVGYWMLMAVIYPLVILAEWREEFFVTMGAYILAIPFFVGAFSLKLEADITAVGFSGFTSALVGFLIVVLFAAIHHEEDGPHPVWALGPGLLAIAGAVALMSYSTWYLATALTTVAILGVPGLVVTAVMVWSHDDLLAWGRSDYWLLYVVGMAVAFAVWLTGFFMTDPKTSTNTLGHFAGLVAGFGFPYWAFGLNPMTERLTSRFTG